MPLTATLRYGANCLIPSHNPDLARTIAASMVPGTYAAGTVLGQVTSANVNDVQTITITGTPTGGSFTYTFSGQTATIPYNATAAAAQALIQALSSVGAGNIVVTGGPGPGTPWVLTGAGAFAGRPLPAATVVSALTGGSSPAVANVHTTTGVGPKGSWGPYASGNSDGTQLPRAILKYAVIVDQSGNVTGIGQWGASYLSTPAYNRGQFFTADLVGLDANAVTAGPFRILSGAVTAGEIELP